MKEALSKKLILVQLVIKIGTCATPPSPNPPLGNGNRQVSVQ